MVSTLELSGTLRLLASNCAYLGREGNTIELTLDPRSDSLLTRQRKDALARVLSEHYGEKLNVEVRLGVAEEKETPVQRQARAADEQIEAARQSLEADPNVQTLKNMFGAELKTDSIEPINQTQTD